MDDDELFEQRMASEGVERLGAEGAGRRRRSDAVSEEDRRLFEQALAEMEVPVVPDRRRGPGASPAVRRVKARRRERVEEHVDLHRLKSRDALRRLERFVAESRAAGLRSVLVITGKGHHSPGGRGVLKQRVEEWIVGPGGRYLESYAEAPRRLGGGGAYVLHLRRRGPS